jgi:polyhydroxybutyrate depolymerase
MLNIKLGKNNKLKGKTMIKTNNYRRAKNNISLLLLTSFLYACGGSSNNDSEAKDVPTPPVTISDTCAGTSLSSDNACITINGRESIVYRPANQLNDGVAIFLHGSPGTANKVMNIFAAKHLAEQYNLISIAPEGTTSVWGWESVNAAGSDTKDVDYITELITKVRGDYNVSSDKLYIFGYSAGGFMAYKLACNMPEQITAIVSLAGQYRGDFSACDTATPVNVHHFHSKSDQEVPYLGRPFGEIKAVSTTIGHWVNKNGCDVDAQNSTQVGVTSSSTMTETSSYQNCLKSVTLSKMQDVPHEADYLSDSLLEIYSHIFLQD